MNWPTRKVKNRRIRILYSLAKQEGFVGMLLVMIMSVAIFTILSSVHIYTVNHARYQSGIKEAYIMQTEIENFAIVVSDSYNKGRDGCDPSNVCCTFGAPPNDITFEFKGTGNCNDLEGVCLTSSGEKDYCLVKLEDASSSPMLTTITIPPPTPLISASQTEQLRACLLQNNASGCSSSKSPPTPVADLQNTCNSGPESGYTGQSQGNLCKYIASNKARYPDLNDGEIETRDAINTCCNGYNLLVINCNDSSNQPPSPPPPDLPCKDYETWGVSKSKQKMWCEICEISNPKRLFTYYVCPATGTPPDPTDCFNMMNDPDVMKKAQSGVFYQTFRVLAH